MSCPRCRHKLPAVLLEQAASISFIRHWLVIGVAIMSSVGVAEETLRRALTDDNGQTRLQLNLSQSLTFSTCFASSLDRL